MADTQHLEPGKVLAFSRNIDAVPQQKQARLVSVVDADLGYSEPGVGFNDNDFGISDPEEVFTDDAPTPSGKIAQGERRATFRTFHDGKNVGTRDQAEKLTQLKNPTVRAIAFGKERLRDKMILGDLGRPGGVFGTSIEIGQDGVETEVAFPTANIIAQNENDFYRGKADGDAAGTAAVTLSPPKLKKGRVKLAQSLYDEMGIEAPTIVCELDDFELYKTSVEMMSTDYTGFSKADFARMDEVSDKKEFYLKGYNWVIVPNGRLPGTGVTDEFYVPVFYGSAIAYKERTLVGTKIWEESTEQFAWKCYYKSQHGVLRREDAAVIWIRVKR